jgi:hypothetical protein
VLADLDAAFAAETFVRIDRNRFFIPKFVDVHRTNLDALSTSDAFFSVHFRFVNHKGLLPSEWVKMVTEHVDYPLGLKVC